MTLHPLPTTTPLNSQNAAPHSLISSFFLIDERGVSILKSEGLIFWKWESFYPDFDQSTWSWLESKKVLEQKSVTSLLVKELVEILIFGEKSAKKL